MSRVILFGAMLLTAGLSAGAQSYPNGSFDRMFPSESYSHGQPAPIWHAAMVPNSRFPLRLAMKFTENRYDGFNFRGAGDAELLGTSSSKFVFSYRCDLSLLENSWFEARWVKPGVKLEVLLENPSGTHTRTCRVSTKPS